jgi:hypothetical protein
MSPAAEGGRARLCEEPTLNELDYKTMRRDITYLIKINLYAAHVCRTDGYHAEKPVPPTPKKRNTLIEHEQILGTLRNPRRDREQFTCHDVQSVNRS